MAIVFRRIMLWPFRERIWVGFEPAESESGLAGICQGCQAIAVKTAPLTSDL
jgi:hypothetical protein